MFHDLEIYVQEIGMRIGRSAVNASEKTVLDMCADLKNLQEIQKKILKINMTEQAKKQIEELFQNTEKQFRENTKKNTGKFQEECNKAMDKASESVSETALQEVREELGNILTDFEAVLAEQKKANDIERKNTFLDLKEKVLDSVELKSNIFSSKEKISEKISKIFDKAMDSI